MAALFQRLQRAALGLSIKRHFKEPGNELALHCNIIREGFWFKNNLKMLCQMGKD